MTESSKPSQFEKTGQCHSNRNVLQRFISGHETRAILRTGDRNNLFNPSLGN